MKKLLTIINILSLLTVSFFTLYSRNTIFLIVFLVALLAVLSFLINKQRLWRRVKPMIGVGLLIIVFNTIIGQFPTGLLTAIKIVIISLSVFYFMTVTSLSSLINLLDFLPNKLRLLLALTFNLIPWVLNESEQIALVQKARGTKYNPIAILIPLLHRVFDRSQTLTYTIISRGFAE